MKIWNPPSLNLRQTSCENVANTKAQFPIGNIGNWIWQHLRIGDIAAKPPLALAVCILAYCAAIAFAGDESSMTCQKGAAHKSSRSGLYCTKCHEPIFSNPVRFACDNDVLTRAYEVALNDALLNIHMFQDGALTEPARCIMAGEIYDTPWTRDAAINVWNAFALLDRDVSRNTLMSVEIGRASCRERV